MIWGWAPGGTAYVAPPVAGFLAGANTTRQSLMLQIHYTNPLLRANITDRRRAPPPRPSLAHVHMHANVFTICIVFAYFTLFSFCKFYFHTPRLLLQPHMCGTVPPRSPPRWEGSFAASTAGE